MLWWKKKEIVDVTVDPVPPHDGSKIRLVDNKKLSDSEFLEICKICDIFTAIADVAGDHLVSPPNGGVFWENAKQGIGPYGLHIRKNREEIEHSFLFNTRFRDFPTIAYEHDHYTPKPDYWLRKYQRLIQGVPENWHVKIPARCGEIGWNINGYPVNKLTSVNQERVNILYYVGVLNYLQTKKNPKILEIGAGGGELGYFFSNALAGSCWVNCDLLASLAYAAIHLYALLKNKSHYIFIGDLDLPNGLDEKYLLRNFNEIKSQENTVISVPHFLRDQLPHKFKFDLIYNTYSFGEMPSESVIEYADFMSEHLRDDGFLFEQNGHFNNARSVESILSVKFDALKWMSMISSSEIKISAPTRIWKSKNSNRNISFELSEIERARVLKSMRDYADSVDNELTLDPWIEVFRHFPQGV